MIVQEAGGVVIDVSGGKYDIMKPNVIVAGNQGLANQLKDLITEIDQRLEAEGKTPEQLKNVK